MVSRLLILLRPYKTLSLKVDLIDLSEDVKKRTIGEIYTGELRD